MTKTVQRLHNLPCYQTSAMTECNGQVQSGEQQVQVQVAQPIQIAQNQSQNQNQPKKDNLLTQVVGGINTLINSYSKDSI